MASLVYDYQESITKVQCKTRKSKKAIRKIKNKTKQINICAGQVIALDCILATQISGKVYETKQCKHRNREANNAATKKILYYWEKKNL